MIDDTLYRVVDVQTEEVVYEGVTIEDLRVILNDIFWQEYEPDFSEATYDEIYYALLGCDYEVDVI